MPARQPRRCHGHRRVRCRWGRLRAVARRHASRPGSRPPAAASHQRPCPPKLLHPPQILHSARRSSRSCLPQLRSRVQLDCSTCMERRLGHPLSLARRRAGPPRVAMASRQCHPLWLLPAAGARHARHHLCLARRRRCAPRPAGCSATAVAPAKPLTRQGAGLPLPSCLHGPASMARHQSEASARQGLLCRSSRPPAPPPLAPPVAGRLLPASTNRRRLRQLARLMLVALWPPQEPRLKSRSGGLPRKVRGLRRLWCLPAAFMPTPVSRPGACC